MDEKLAFEGAVCPVPLAHNETIMLGHGSGGKMAHDLIRKIFLPALSNPILEIGDDAASVQIPDGRALAISTDAHVVFPLFFPGGDIGRLAVCGTVNDVSMLAAEPYYLTASFILEEGLSVETLWRIVVSMQAAASEAGVRMIAGDTKVVQKGHADGLYISTTGVGAVFPGYSVSGRLARPGDSVILSGPIGDHGMAVLGARGELGFESDIQSDVAPLNHMIKAICQSSAKVHVLRDPTRGGVATTLNEIARQSGVCIEIQEDSIPVRPAVAAACEMLGFDPLYVANEGKLIVIAAPEDEGLILKTMQDQPYGKESCVIGYVLSEPHGRVLMRTLLGSTRIIDMLAGEMLPRIC